MAPRRRYGPSRGLPDNLFAQRKGGAIYYRYRNPVTGKMTGFGTDKATAIRAAKKANSWMPVTPEEVRLLARISGDESLEAYIAGFIEHTLPELKSRRGRYLSEETTREYRRMLLRTSSALGHYKLYELSRRHVADFLRQFPNTASNRYRAVVSLLCRHAVADGRMESNPVEKTLPKSEEIKRQRLSLEPYHAIHRASQPWMQNAMDLALHTLQRREDIVRMRFDDVKDGTLLVRQGKTATGIRIALRKPLLDRIVRCRDNIPSPFLVHRKPAKRSKSAKRDHWTQVLPPMVSRAFQDVRDELGLFDHLEILQRPTFHEIRSLGSDLYRKAGQNPKDLLGHESQATTDGYLEGHEHWVDVVAGLDLDS